MVHIEAATVPYYPLKTVCGEKMDLSPGMVSFVCVPSTWPGLRRKGVYTAGVSDTYAEEKKAGEKKQVTK